MDYPTQNSINNNSDSHFDSYSGGRIIPKDHLLDQNDWMVFGELLNQDISSNTKKALICDIKHFLSWYVRLGEPFRFNRLTTRDIIDYKNDCSSQIKHKPATINRRFISIRTMCKFAVEMGRMKRNPAEKVKQLPLQPLAPKGLSKQELRKLMKEVELRGSPRDKLIMEMMWGAGLRVCELTKLNMEDIEITERKGHALIRYSKGGKSRKVPLSSTIRTLVHNYLSLTNPNPQDRLFVGQRGPLTTIAFNKIVESYARRAQIKCSPHTLRHTFAYAYLEKNPGDIVGLAQLLGHSNIQTTAIYTHHRLEDLQERVEGVHS